MLLAVLVEEKKKGTVGAVFVTLFFMPKKTIRNDCVRFVLGR